MKSRGNWSLIGFPDHLGVMHVGGRIGAAGGPQAFRKAFFALNSKWNARPSLGKDVDIAPMTSDVSQNHTLAVEAVQAAHREAAVSVVVGGGHDYAYPHLLGIATAYSLKPHQLACINIDAHFDLRAPLDEKKITSGSGFYLAIETGVLSPKGLVEFGIQRHCNRTALWEYAQSKAIETVEMSALRNGEALVRFRKILKKLAAQAEIVVISLDLDAIGEAYAPGVSAPQPDGFLPGEVIDMMTAAGKEPKVRSLGIFELNPEHDIQGRTARCAAQAAYAFIEAKCSEPVESKPKVRWPVRRRVEK